MSVKTRCSTKVEMTKMIMPEDTELVARQMMNSKIDGWGMVTTIGGRWGAGGITWGK